MKRILLLALALMIGVLIVLLINYFSMRSSQEQVQPIEPLVIDDAAVERLSEAIQIETVSGRFEPAVFISFLKNRFPTLHQHLEHTVVNDGGLVFHWRAKKQRRKPILLLAHYDVVPAKPEGWQNPPFSGVIDDKYVWGRGAMDDKSSLMAMLEAVEMLLNQAYQPDRDIYFAFGHDEETGGLHGAAQIAHYFSQKNLKFEYILDEGLVISDGILSFVNKPVALIGIAEKGYADIELTLTGSAGHASMPGSRTLLGDLSTAISRIQAQPLAARFTEPTLQMLMTLAPESEVVSRLSFTNLWLFKPFVMQKFEQMPATHAAINTTLAPTQMFASDRPNVLPPQVRAIINVRILPGTTSEQVADYLRQVMADARIEVRILQSTEASTVSSTSSAAYRKISQAVRQVFTDTLVAPGLVIPATDSRHYRALALEAYRFLPIKVNTQDLARFHGRDERIAKSAYRDAIRFYYQCIKNTTGH